MGSLIAIFLGLTILNVILLFLDIGIVYLVIVNVSLFIATMVRIVFYLHSFYDKYVIEGKKMSERIIEARKANP